MPPAGHDQELTFRRAQRAELPQIVSLLADDEIGRTREVLTEDLTPYDAAWTAMEADSANWLLVAAVCDEVVGVLQLTLIAGLSRTGTRRGQIEGVRVKPSARGQAVGKRLVTFAMDMAKANSCGLVQLTTDRRRGEAKRFYESLGFADTHAGMKRIL